MSEKFIYANGRIRALELTFVSSRTWQMLLSAGDEEEALRLLTDTWYGEFISQHHLDSCFEEALTSTEEELIQLSEDKRLVRGLLHRRDVRNARYIWKNALLGDFEEIELEKSGLIDTETLKRSVKEVEIREDLPLLFRETLEEILSTENLKVRNMDLLMDHLAVKVELEEIPELGKELHQFIKLKIEMKNFLISGRCKVAGVLKREIEPILLSGGIHTTEEVASAYQLGQLSELLSESTDLENIANLLNKSISGGSFLDFQKECDRILIDRLETASSTIVFGPEPLAAFVLKREMEILHLKLLLSGKATGMASGRLKNRLPRG